MNTSSIEKRLVGQVPATCGTLTDIGGRTVPVNFSLSQWQLSIGGIPVRRSADGEIEFLNIADAFDLRDVNRGVTLEGGGIRAEVSMRSLRAFTVMDGYVSDASMLGHLEAPRAAELIHQ